FRGDRALSPDLGLPARLPAGAPLPEPPQREASALEARADRRLVGDARRRLARRRAGAAAHGAGRRPLPVPRPADLPLLLRRARHARAAGTDAPVGDPAPRRRQPPPRGRGAGTRAPRRPPQARPP